MKTRQVKWVVRNESDVSRRISRIGGDDFDHSIVEAIMNIHLDRCRYWFIRQNEPLWIVIDTRPGTPYLRAECDITEPDFLLSLADTPFRSSDSQ